MKQILLALLCSAIFLPALSIAQPAFDGMQRGERFVSKLNLTDTQKEQFKNIRYETEKKNIENNAKLATMRLEIRRLFDAENIDRSAVEKKITEIATLEASIKINRFNAWADCNKILDTNQRKIWKQALAMEQMMNKQGMKRRMMDRPSMPQNHPMK